MKFGLILSSIFWLHLCFYNEGIFGISTEEDPQTIGEAIFLTLFGLDNSSPCLLCGEEDKSVQSLGSNGLRNVTEKDCPLTVEVPYLLLFLLCVKLLIIVGYLCLRLKVYKNQTDTSSRHPCPLVLHDARKDKERYRNSVPLSRKRRQQRFSQKLQFAKRNLDNATSVDVHLLDDNTDTNTGIKYPGILSNPFHDILASEKLPENIVDTLLCVKPNCTQHFHGNSSFAQNKSNEKSPKVNETKSTNITKRSLFSKQNWLFEIGSPQHASTFVEEQAEEPKMRGYSGDPDRCGSSVDPDGFGSSVDPDIFYSSVDHSVHDNPVDPDMQCNLPGISNQISRDLSLSHVERLLDSFQNWTYNRRQGICELADVSSTRARNVLERTSDTARNVVSMTSDSASYVIRKTADGAVYLIDKTRGGTHYIVRKTADGAYYLIERTRDGTHYLVSTLSDAEMSIKNALENENIDIYDCLKEMSNYGEDSPSVYQIVAALLVKMTINRVQRYLRNRDKNNSYNLYSSDSSYNDVTEGSSGDSQFSYESLI